jgi:hypothetical protein
MPAIPASLEADIEGMQSKATPGRNARPYLKNELRANELGPGHGSSGRVLIQQV